MIYLITGVPGSGKTLYATTLIQQFIEEGRAVFSDINGLLIDDVEHAPEDWRETPDGSVVVYDECQMHMGTKLGKNIPDHIEDLTVHRHTGHDIVLITQGPKLLHSFVRPLVGRHYHVERVFGTNNAKLYRAERCMENCSKTDLNGADQTLFPFPKKNFDLYKSATVHTHKAAVPAWLKRTGFVLVALLVGLFFLAQNAGNFFSGSAVGQALGDEQVLPDPVGIAPPVPVSPTHTLTSQPVKLSKIEPPEPIIPPRYPRGISGCFQRISTKTCRCYDYDHTPINMDKVECLNWLDVGIFPRPPGYKRPRRRSESSQQAGLGALPGNRASEI